MTLIELDSQCKSLFSEAIENSSLAYEELTLTLKASLLKSVLLILRDQLDFELLMDIVGIDYGSYGQVEWQTTRATESGFSRAAERDPLPQMRAEQRFACSYLLLSLKHNQRIRLKVFCETNSPVLDSIMDIYPAADWYEREAFDLFGILFKGHPDLRRILTDYGFIGHPFRKDFPLSGQVEMRYDETAGRVVYEPVEIEPRILVPRVIRQEGGAVRG